MPQLPTTNDPTAPATALAIAPAPGRHDLAWLARNPPAWTIDQARQLAGDAPMAAIAEAEMQLRGELAVPPPAGPVRDDWRKALDERLRRLAVKAAPGMSVAQGEEWRTVMVDALSDLPAMVALTAAKRALHRPFRFLNEIEPAIREIAAPITARRKQALARLEDLRAAIDRAMDNAPALPPPPDELSAAEIRAMSPKMRAIGLSCGALTQAQIDAAVAGDDAVTDDVGEERRAA